MRKTKISKVMITVLISILLFSTVVIATEAKNVKINLNGVELKLPEEYGQPFIDNQSRTMIPLRIISERLGHKVEWDNATRTASIDNKVFITIGKNVVTTPNDNIQMDTVAILKDDGRTYVPLRFVVEALGYEVSYDGPKSSNNYNHIVNIFKEGMTTPTQPVKEGSVYKIKTETGVVEVNLDTDTNMYGEIVDEKATELMRPVHRSMKLTETKDSVKITFHLPEMPKEAGLKYNATLTLQTKEGNHLGIWSENGKGSFTTNLGNGYYEVNYNMDMSQVEYIVFASEVSNNGDTSIPYQSELRTGVEAIGQNEYLLDKVDNLNK